MKIHMSKSRALSPLPFAGKHDYYLQYLGFLPGNKLGSQIKGLESKFDKNILVPTFSSFAAIDNEGHFRKKLTRFSSLAAFLGTMPTF